MPHTDGLLPDRTHYVVYARAIEKRTFFGQRRKVGGGLRGDVVGFSKESRLRLMKTLAKARSLPKWFVTLTYPSAYPAAYEAKEDCKRFLDNLSQWHRNNGKRLFVIWRLEFQSRGAPHFHLLMWSDWEKPLMGSKAIRQARWKDAIGHFKEDGWWWNYDKGINTTSWEQWRAWLSVGWWFRTKTGDIDHLRAGVDIRQVDSPKQVTSYISKYVAKIDERGQEHLRADAGGRIGRLWGKVGDHDFVGFQPIGSMTDVVPALAKYFDQGIAERVGTPYALAAVEGEDLSYYLFTDEVIAKQLALDLNEWKLEIGSYE